MVKLILLVRRKPGIDRAAFRDYYETRHAPLAATLMAHCKRYIRNFVAEDIGGPADFDAVTEFWFDVEGPWSQAQQQLTDQSARDVLEADEARFMDRSSMRVVRVEECATPSAQLLGNRS